MRELKLIYEEGRRILYLDFSNMKVANEVQEMLLTAGDFINQQEEKSLLVLSKVDRMFYDTETIRLLTKVLISNKPFIKLSAVVGISGYDIIVHKLVMDKAQRRIKCFDTVDDAKTWLLDECKEFDRILGIEPVDCNDYVDEVLGNLDAECDYVY